MSPTLAFDFADLAYLALSIFLLAVGLGLGYAFVRLGGTLSRLSAFIRGTQQELLPVINKVGGTVDRVNSQLDKVDRVTDSAVDAADSADTAVRAVSYAIKRPVQKVSGLAAGLTFGLADFKTHHDWRAAVAAAREAAARRERELAEELEAAGSRRE
jgi:ABC-type transporter Mla subunit MlaD